MSYNCHRFVVTVTEEERVWTELPAHACVKENTISIGMIHQKVGRINSATSYFFPPPSSLAWNCHKKIIHESERPKRNRVPSCNWNMCRQREKKTVFCISLTLPESQSRFLLQWMWMCVKALQRFFFSAFSSNKEGQREEEEEVIHGLTRTSLTQWVIG